MDSPTTEDSIESSTTSSISCVLKEEMQLAHAWSARDQMEHDHGEREIADRLIATRYRLENLRARVDVIWERFITLSLDRIISQQLRAFLDELDGETQDLVVMITELDCEIDRIRVRVQDRQRALAQKTAQLEPLAHRAFIEAHFNMMLGRVEGLESCLSGLKVKEQTPQPSDLQDRLHTRAPGDLLYLRIRLLTTRIAVKAANLCRHLVDLDAQLATSLLNIEQLKTLLTPLATRIECLAEQARYWLLYLEIYSPQDNS